MINYTKMDKKQTAVDWLVEQIKSDQNQKSLSASEWMQVINQAKQMEKEQLIDAFYQCGKDNFEHIKVINRSATDYYNETYGSKGSDEIGSSLEWNGEVTQGSDDQVPDFSKMVEDDNYLTPVDWLMDIIKWIHRETYDYLIKEGKYDVAKRTENAILDKTNELESSQTEISDEEIGKETKIGGMDTSQQLCFQLGAKWYREQLKKKQL